MARPLQKKKNRSSLPRVRQKQKKRFTGIKGNAIVAENWNDKETLTQNYRRLGLTSRLNAATGGIEKQAINVPQASTLDVPKSSEKKLQTGEVRVERDAKTGAITRIIRDDDDSERENPLNDPLNHLSDDEHAPSQIQNIGIIPQLEAYARNADGVKTAGPRKQSRREREWIEALIQKYGTNDFHGMMRDRKLNPMQQSEGELKRRIGIWTKEEEQRKANAS